jgi:hypothetical protein
MKDEGWMDGDGKCNVLPPTNTIQHTISSGFSALHITYCIGEKLRMRFEEVRVRYEVRVRDEYKVFLVRWDRINMNMRDWISSIGLGYRIRKAFIVFRILVEVEVDYGMD